MKTDSYAKLGVNLLMAVGDDHLLTRFGERGNVKNALHRFIQTSVGLRSVERVEQGVSGPFVIAVAFNIIYDNPIVDRQHP